jgi:FkbM family methyltransferase
MNFGLVDKSDIAEIEVNGHKCLFQVSGAGWRFETLGEKEPETIEWIDTFEKGDIFWDIGANVGIYSIYASVQGFRSLSFEPHFANYHQLCINIALNQLEDIVTPICLAFTNTKTVDRISLASTSVGSSMSSFGDSLDFRGRPYTPEFRQGMIGYDIDSFVRDFSLEHPNHIKIDVDGKELSILNGAIDTLRNPRVKSVSIELIDSDSEQVSAVSAIMWRSGLKFVHKRQNSRFATNETKDVLNYLFHRDPQSFLRRSSSLSQRDE